ncbi:MAG: DUF885 domain-containing protein [Lachnospiraceae bacterium]|nr:DUF885 domain-containing protein [Lachnospiraceae bacterium]
MPKKSLRLAALFLTLLLTLPVSACRTDLLPCTAKARFYHSSDALFRAELSEDPLNLHFTLADPGSEGIDPPADFPSLGKKERVRRNLLLSETLSDLQRVDASRLDDTTAFSLEVMKEALSASVDSERFIYFYEPFSATRGVQSEYPLLLSEYAFRNEEDVALYLHLLEQTPAYFDSLLEFEKEKIRAGFPLTRENADGAIEACDSFAHAGAMFDETFAARIGLLVEKGILTEKEAASYEASHKRIVDTILLPAFLRLGDSLLVLKSDGEREKGLFYKSGGRVYYDHLLRENVGTDKDVRALKKLLLQDLRQNLSALNALLASADLNRILRTEDPLQDLPSSKIPEDLKTRMREDFPLEDPTDYPYEVAAVAPCLEPYTAPAYYFTPPIDALHDNHIYINESQTKAGLQLYTTLAHEGFPGHLYQTVTSLRAFEQTHQPMLRRIISYGGYVEGYATYAEFYSYAYAKECATELLCTAGNAGSAKDVRTYYDLMYYDRRIKLCLYCLADIMIHGEGQSREQIAEYLGGFGIRDPETADQIYDYILCEPTTYLKYYVGYLEILRCRDLARKNWGKHYSDRAFHLFLLKTGPAPFWLIKKECRLRHSRAERGCIYATFMLRASVHP